jgi:hypothetical protein
VPSDKVEKLFDVLLISLDSIPDLLERALRLLEDVPLLPGYFPNLDE